MGADGCVVRDEASRGLAASAPAGVDVCGWMWEVAWHGTSERWQMQA